MRRIAAQASGYVVFTLRNTDVFTFLYFFLSFGFIIFPTSMLNSKQAQAAAIGRPLRQRDQEFQLEGPE